MICGPEDAVDDVVRAVRARGGARPGPAVPLRLPHPDARAVPGPDPQRGGALHPAPADHARVVRHHGLAVSPRAGSGTGVVRTAPAGAGAVPPDDQRDARRGPRAFVQLGAGQLGSLIDDTLPAATTSSSPPTRAPGTASPSCAGWSPPCGWTARSRTSSRWSAAALASAAEARCPARAPRHAPRPGRGAASPPRRCTGASRLGRRSRGRLARPAAASRAPRDLPVAARRTGRPAASRHRGTPASPPVTRAGDAAPRHLPQRPATAPGTPAATAGRAVRAAGGRRGDALPAGPLLLPAAPRLAGRGGPLARRARHHGHRAPHGDRGARGAGHARRRPCATYGC